MHDPQNPDELTDDLPKSKSRRKREMLALQDLGEQLAQLKPEQLSQVPLDDDLRQALEQLQRINSHEARRRQLQYIGKRMRVVDVAPIYQALAGLQAGSLEDTRRLHLAEQWRDRLSDEGNAAVTEFMAQYPHTEVQHLRNLVRNARQDLQTVKNRGNGRKLFRYIRARIDEAEQRTSSEPPRAPHESRE